MENNEDNKKEVKSKIEQIRIDLEKKFAALELAKLKKSGLYIEKEKSDDEAKITSEKKIETKSIDKKPKTQPEKKADFEKEDNAIAKEKEEQPAFEISDLIVSSISELEKKQEENKKTDNLGANKETQRERKKINKIVAPIPPIKKKQIEKKEVEQKKETTEKKKVVIAPSTISNKNKTDVAKSDVPKEAIQEEKKEEKSKLNYIIYGIAGILFFVVGYLVLDFYNDTKAFEEEKTERLISKYKNKSYLDSIELADANSQLLDYQNQYLIDSIANTYEVDLRGSNSRGIVNSNSRGKDKKETSSVKNKKNNSAKEEATKKKNRVLEDGSLAKNKDINNTVVKEINEAINGVATEANDAVNSEDAINGGTSDIAKNTEEEKKVKEKSTTDNNNTVKSKITNSPIYPGCEKKKSELSKKKCLTSKMLRHVQKKFNSDLAQNVGLKKGLNKIKVSFVIDKNGYANVLYVRTQNKKVEKEAIRVIQSLPRMTPGRVNGKIAQMKYVVPIQFKVKN